MSTEVYEHEVLGPSANRTVGRNRTPIDEIIIHWWGEPESYREENDVDQVIRFLLEERTANPSSAHAVISGWPRARVAELVPREDTAWQAGVWDVNLRTLGYELQPFNEWTPSLIVERIFETAATYLAWVWHKIPTLKNKPFGIHNAYKPTTCPGAWMQFVAVLFVRTQELFPYVLLDEPGKVNEGAPPLRKELFMQNPFVGRVTSEFGPRNGKLHAGIDIAPPVAGTTGLPVFAAYNGRVEKTVSTQKLGAKTGVLWSGRTGNGVIVRNPDGERQVYNHIRPAVKVGGWVNKGDVVGFIDLSGNISGPHLHFEIWDKAGEPRNPRIDFGVAKLKPGVGAPMLSKRKFLPLSTDGLWGHKTITELERALAATGYYKGLIEEDVGKVANAGPVLWHAYQEYLADQGADVGPADGDFGERSRKAEQAWLNKIGYYPWTPPDGVRGEGTINALQRALNADEISQKRPTPPTPPIPTPDPDSPPDVPPSEPPTEPVDPPAPPDPVDPLPPPPDDFADQVAELVVQKMIKRIRDL